MFPLNKPQVLEMQAQEKFDANGRLVDETTRGFLGDPLIALADWTRLLRPRKGFSKTIMQPDNRITFYSTK
jgi:hypothetical protein